ncbi:MAG: peptide-binding protein [Candidatus Omnitrophica bacterium]|nr:peptide-binding protein [Candidatus Omnitrophota bacterium]
MFKIRLLQVVCLLCYLFFISSTLYCARAEDNSCSYGDAIVTGSIGDARTLVPILASDSASGTICGLVFNGLIKYDKDINLVGDLAESWEIQQDGLVIIFHLRKNVRWQDGEPFTANDVEFTYRKLIDPKVKTPYGGDFEKVKSLKVIDDHTIKVTYKEPFSPGLASWGMSIMPQHLLGQEDLNDTSFSRSPIGTGPYKFKQWKTAEKIELVSNHDYFEGRPFIDRYIYRIIPDQATMFLELRAQGVDQIGLTPLQYERQTETNFFKQTFRKYRYPSFGYTYLGFNLLNPKFQDKRVRQAISFAIDKDEIIEGILLGLGRVCTGPFPPESWAYNKQVQPFPFDPETSKQLLRAAGWADTDGDGWLDKEGQRFEFTIVTNQGNAQRKMCAEIIQRRLAEIGIKVKIKIIEWSSFISEFVDKKKFDALILGWSLSRDPDSFDIWHSSKTKEGEFNFISYNNPELDQLTEQGRRIFDQDQRKQIYHRIHEILHEDQPYVFLYVPDALPIVHQRFRGIQPAPLGIGYNFIKWHVPKTEQKYTR